jgi:response regulator RpfG family c-di-GMP phosphodiesterase
VAVTWELELAAMLSPLGIVTIPASVLSKTRSGQSLTPQEQDLMDRVPDIGAKLLENIPRLDQVAAMVRYQCKGFDGSGVPVDGIRGEDIPIASRIMKVLSDMLDRERRGLPRFKALKDMQTQAGLYDPRVLDAAFKCFDIYLDKSSTTEAATRAIAFAELQTGHIVTENVMTMDGKLIVPTRTIITPPILEKLRNFAILDGIKEPVHIEG